MYLWIITKNVNPIIRCNAENICGEHIHLVNYILENNKDVSNLEELISYLDINKVNYKLKEKESPVSNKVLNLTQKHFVDNLLKDSDNKAFQYLTKNRGYSEEDIKDMGLGYFKSLKDLDNFLLETKINTNSIMKSFSRTIDYKGNIRINTSTEGITIPVRDKDGTIKYFVIRNITESSENKYLLPKSARRIIPFNVNNIKVNTKKDSKDIDLIIVEGYFDQGCSMLC